VKRVVVLGCGPAGLLAAHAASMAGADVKIISIKRQSPINGAQYLHREIPGLTHGPDGWITYIKTGGRDGYARKVYGTSDLEVSWDHWDAASKPAWSMQKIYTELWGMYEQGIQDYEVKPGDIRELESEYSADLLITSLPLHLICEHKHIFQSVEMYIKDGFSPGVIIPLNTIIYNGHEGVPWHRASNLFGFKSMEYGAAGAEAGLMANPNWTFYGLKPTEHNCDCHPHWMRVGRFGQWKRGVLVHHAFEEVERAMLTL
jgi:hypothetical protein